MMKLQELYGCEAEELPYDTSLFSDVVGLVVVVVVRKEEEKKTRASVDPPGSRESVAL